MSKKEKKVRKPTPNEALKIKNAELTLTLSQKITEIDRLNQVISSAKDALGQIFGADNTVYTESYSGRQEQKSNPRTLAQLVAIAISRGCSHEGLKWAPPIDLGDIISRHTGHWPPASKCDRCKAVRNPDCACSIQTRQVYP